MIRQATIEGELWHLVVRRDLGHGRQLVSVHVQLGGEVIATVADSCLLVQVVTAFDADLITLQILEVVRIADLGVVNFGQHARIKPALVLPVVHVAGFFVVGLQLAIVVVVVEVRGTELSFAGLGQVAELTFHQQTALGHVARVQRGIVVGCQVEVVRGHERKAGVGAAAEGRRQETGLTAIVDREVNVRGVKDWNVFNPQCHVGCGTETGGRVQRDVVAFKLPGVAVRLARGVRTVLESDDRVFGTFGVQRAAANTRLVQHVLGVVDLGGTGVQLHIGVVANQQCTVVTQTHIAAQLATALGLVQVGFVSLDLHAALAHDHITGQGRDLLFLLVAGSFGANEGRRIAFAGGVAHAGTRRLDIGARAIRAGFSQLRRRELVTRDPVKVAVVSTARLEATTFGGCHQRGLLTLLARLTIGLRHGAVVRWAWWQLRSICFRRAIPATRSRCGTVILLLGKYEWHG